MTKEFSSRDISPRTTCVTAMHAPLVNHLNLTNQEIMTMMINVRAKVTALHTTHQETHNNLIEIKKLPPIYPCMTRWEW